MSHFGFVSPPYKGHLNPMQALAGELVGRGHRATFFGIPDTGEAIDRERFGFWPLGEDTHGPGTLDRLEDRLAAPRGLNLVRVLRDMGSLSAMLCRTAPEAMRRAGVEALVVDQLEPAGGIAAEALGLPFVSVANALLIDRDPAVPPPYTAWNYDATERGLRRNRGGYRVADWLMAGYGRSLARQAGRLGLPPRRGVEGWRSRLATISQTVEPFDFPRLEADPRLHHCGPLRPPDEPADLSDLLPDGRPLAFASLGTLQGGRIDLFGTIAAVCAEAGLHLVIAHGGRLPDEAVRRLPGRPTVRSFVPQRALLRHATLAIVNGGLNTVMDALAAAVPLVVVPVAFEQGAVAARVRHAGVGLAVPARQVTEARLRDAVGTVLADPRFRERARALRGAIRTAGGVGRAATIVEEATAATGLRLHAQPSAPIPLRSSEETAA